MFCSSLLTTSTIELLLSAFAEFSTVSFNIHPIIFFYPLYGAEASQFNTKAPRFTRKELLLSMFQPSLKPFYFIDF